MPRHEGLHMRKIPKTMSTQHPDNARMPEWVNGEIIAWEDEVYETYYVFSRLGAQEQMWDWEGKDVDPHVVRKLLELFPEFFHDHVLGTDVFLTYRVPNPSVEEAEKKGLVEALESIPFSYDAAVRFYGSRAPPPVFEVILPLTKSYMEPLMVLAYYRKLVAGRGRVKLIEGSGITVADWIGEFRPATIEVIPLVEDMESLLSIDSIVMGFVKAVKPPYVRAFVARSDPALNYGLPAAVILAKAAKAKLDKVSEELGVPVYAIIGSGPPPFRGHLTPRNVDRFLEEYGSYWTATIQSAFKYDYGEGEVRAAIERLNAELGTGSNAEAEEGISEEGLVKRLLAKLSATYRSRVEKLHLLIGEFSELVPRRRARRLHVGLFGYSRSTGRVRLPRAIRFTAALYSLGIPPEVLGVEALAELSDGEWELFERLYVNWRADLEAAARRVCWDNVNLLLGDERVYRDVVLRLGAKHGVAEVVRDLEVLESEFGIRTGPRNLSDRRYDNEVNNVLLSYAEGNISEARRSLENAARMRQFLG